MSSLSELRRHCPFEVIDRSGREEIGRTRIAQMERVLERDDLGALQARSAVSAVRASDPVVALSLCRAVQAR